MPVFKIDAPNGDVYEVEAPEGATKEQAFEFFKREHSAGRLAPKEKKQSSLLDNPVTGAVETGLSMITGGLAQPIAGLAGIASGGSGDVVRDVQDALTYQPKGTTGKKYAENVGKVFSAPIEWAGKKAYDLTGSEAARSVAEAGTEIGLNFLPIGAAAKGAKGLVKKPVTKLPTKDLTSIEKSIDVAKGKEVETPLPETIYTDSSGVSRESLPDAGELASRKAHEQQLKAEKDKAISQLAPEKAFQSIVDHSIEGWNEPIKPKARWDDILSPTEQGKQAQKPSTSEFELAARREAQLRQIDDAQVTRLETALNKANPEQPTIYVDSQGRQLSPDKLQSLEAARAEFETSAREVAAQNELARRQAEMELDVRRRQQLEFNAAERARQEQASTGYSDYVQRMQEDANTLRRGDVSPINFEKIPVPYGLADDPYLHKGGLDYSNYLAEGKSYPIVKQEQMKTAFEQRAIERQAEVERAAAHEDRLQKEQDSLMPVEETLRKEAYRPPTREQLRADRGRPTKPGFRQKQSGGIDLQAISEGFQKIKSLLAKSPEVVAAKAQLEKESRAQKAKEILGSTSGYIENIRSPEAVIAASQTAKDIPRSAVIGIKTVTPGINNLAVKHPNPLIKYMRYTERQVRHAVNGAIEKYVTGPEGIGKTIRKLSDREQTEVWELLKLGDKKQYKITEDIMRKHGFSENQIEFVNKFYEMDKAEFDLHNQKLAESGMPTFSAREGHVPGVFKGDYKQLVLDTKKNPIGFIGVDSKWQLNKAREAYKKLFPDAVFTPVERSKLGGSAARGREFAQMQEVLKLLAQHDDHFKKVGEEIGSIMTKDAEKASQAVFHTMQKKGILGNEGNKPWKDAETNAKEGIKNYLEHWEAQVTSHHNLPVERDMRALMQNPELKNADNAKEAVDAYIKNMTGRNVGETGQALNTLIDSPSRFLGFGPSWSRAAVNQLNKRAGQWTMGFGNVLYTFTQLLQVPQMAIPEMHSLAKELNIPFNEINKSFGKASTDLMLHFLGKEDAFSAETVKQARERGLLTFSEFSDVNKITQGKASAAFDKVVDFNRNELGERPTRPLVFMAAVDLLKKQGLEGDVLYDSAYNATQSAMVDYHPNEKPAIYQRMGVTGQLAGGIATFKHASLNQLNRFVKQAMEGNPGPLLSAAVMIGVFAGLKGIPGYDDANSAVEYITQKFFDKRQSIAELTMKNLPEMAKSGVLSDVLDINMSSRLSTANVIPDTPVEAALGPWSSFYGKKIGSLADVASHRDMLSVKHAATELAPNQWKGAAEQSMLSDEEGYILDKKGLRGNQMTDHDKNVRLYTGGQSLAQANLSAKQWMGTKRRMGYKETQKAIMEDLQRKLVQGNLTNEDTQEAAKRYAEVQGDPVHLAKQLIEYAKTAKLNKQQRLQGIPNGNLSSLYRYMEYNE